MSLNPTNYYCIHGIHAQEPCPDCEKDAKDGWITQRRVYHSKALYKARRRLMAQCKNCGDERGGSPYASRCQECAEEFARYIRERAGWKPWVKGGRGRPPKSSKNKV